MPIKMYLNNEDFWSTKVYGELDDLMDLFPDNLNLSHSKILYISLQRCNSVPTHSQTQSNSIGKPAKIDLRKKPQEKSNSSKKKDVMKRMR
jgi:hypothetical protein